MKAKREFYMNGNDRKFADDYTISIMTGEPMPKKWQGFIELTPVEKARWDASLKLDEEYRIAEAQGFPNGIPGGRTRGDILYYLTQQEEAHNRSLQEGSFFSHSFIPQKTEIQIDGVNTPNNTPAYRQNSFLQTNASIKKEPAFDVDQAIRKIASWLEAR